MYKFNHTRNLKKNLGEKIYKELIEKNKNFYRSNTLEEEDKKRKNDYEFANKISKNEFIDKPFSFWLNFIYDQL